MGYEGCCKEPHAFSSLELLFPENVIKLSLSFQLGKPIIEGHSIENKGSHNLHMAEPAKCLMIDVINRILPTFGEWQSLL